VDKYSDKTCLTVSRRRTRHNDKEYACALAVKRTNFYTSA
jgi:hypothetical protein